MAHIGGELTCRLIRQSSDFLLPLPSSPRRLRGSRPLSSSPLPVQPCRWADLCFLSAVGVLSAPRDYRRSYFSKSVELPVLFIKTRGQNTGTNVFSKMLTHSITKVRKVRAGPGLGTVSGPLTGAVLSFSAMREPQTTHCHKMPVCPEVCPETRMLKKSMKKCRRIFSVSHPLPSSRVLAGGSS